MPPRNDKRKGDVGENDFPAVNTGDRPLFDCIRALYRYRENDLVQAVLAGNRREARRIVNHLLVHIYSAGQQRNELLKGLLLELIVFTSRALMERGASPSALLGLGYQHLTELGRIEDDEQLSAWLRKAFDRIFDEADRLRPPATDAAVEKAVAYMRSHLQEDLSREAVARRAGASAGRLSKRLRERTGRSFVELLRDFRVEEAARQLVDSDASVAEIAQACGFCDQSYFTRVFREARGLTPLAYRAVAHAERIARSA
ncbi:MAG TPA: AraC family transcriptional regulator [Kiritimatiellia bacterium]|nr:AraC family transcriptional regulator [Kiritimatiellia bacterium]